MQKIFDELKRRNVIKALLAYLVVAWVILQVLSIVLPNLNAPSWVLNTIMLLMIVGLPIWVFFSWVYEVTPEGIKKTSEVSQDQSITSVTNKRLNILILAALVVAIAIGVMNRPVLNFNNSISSAGEIAEKSIAVLPFDNMSSDKDNEWFCDGVTEDILTQLSKVKGLKVISERLQKNLKTRKKRFPKLPKNWEFLMYLKEVYENRITPY